MNDVNKLFGKYISSPEKIQAANFPVRESQTRVLVVFTKKGDKLLSEDLYNRISDLSNSSDLWIIESLAPIPLASAQLEKINKQDLENLLIWINKSSLRGILAISRVSYGTIGHGVRFTHGTISSDMASLLEAAFILDKTSSWCRKEIVEIINKFPEDMHHALVQCDKYYELSG